MSLFVHATHLEGRALAVRVGHSPYAFCAGWWTSHVRERDSNMQLADIAQKWSRFGRSTYPCVDTGLSICLTWAIHMHMWIKVSAAMENPYRKGFWLANGPSVISTSRRTALRPSRYVEAYSNSDSPPHSYSTWGLSRPFARPNVALSVRVPRAQ